MIDIHTHILHEIDDGAQTFAQSLELLQLQKSQGVHTVVFTPHFRPKKQNVSEFLSKVQHKFKDFAPLDICLVLGLEVFCEDMSVLNTNLKELCIENTNYILIEFAPLCTKYMIFQIVEALVRVGLTPIIAHVERYMNIMNEPSNLYELVEHGALLQVNAKSVWNNPLLIKALKKHLIHFIASDAHNNTHRAPNLNIAYQFLHENGVNTHILKENAHKMINNQYIDTSNAKKITKVLGMYF